MASSRLMLIPEAIPDGFVACNRAWDMDSHGFYGFSRRSIAATKRVHHRDTEHTEINSSFFSVSSVPLW